MNTDKFPFKKIFHPTPADFSANHAAEEWLKAKGFLWGTMCSPEPRGIVKKETVVALAGEGAYIPKWRRLSAETLESLDGIATADDWRNGDITVHLKSDPG